LALFFSVNRLLKRYLKCTPCSHFVRISTIPRCFVVYKHMY
jgi:hypothetical protein